MSTNGRDDLAHTSIATVALGEGRHAHDRIDGLRERMDWHVEKLNASIAAVEGNAATRAHEHKSEIAAVAATAEAIAHQVDNLHGIVLRADGNAARAADAVERIEKLLGVDIDPRASIVDMTPEELRALEQAGLVPQVRTLIHSLRSARRDARLAVGGMSFVTVATILKILVELLK